MPLSDVAEPSKPPVNPAVTDAPGMGAGGSYEASRARITAITMTRRPVSP